MGIKPGRQMASFLFSLVAMLCLPAVLHAQAQQPVIRDIRIEILDPPGGNPGYWEEVAESLIFLNVGEPFSDKWFAESVEALRTSTLFEKIDIPDPDWTDPPVTLVFRLTPFARIQNIVIDGGFPILEKEIRNAMTINTGQPYIAEVLSEQAERIERLFLDEGFIDPDVSVTPDRIFESGDYQIRVIIDTGRFFRIEKVKIKGNDEISGLWLKLRLSTWQSSFLYGGPSRLVRSEVEDDADTLLDYYRTARYAEARVDQVVDVDRDAGSAAIFFTIEEGPRYDVEILGNDFFWDWTLKKDLAIFEKGNRSGLGLRKTVRNIEKRYQMAGFRDVQVDTDDALLEIDGDAVRKVRIFIDEGPRYLVKRVSVEGNDFFTTERIRKQMLIGPPGLLADGAFVPETLAEDLQAIRTLYLQHGFLDTRIETAVEQNAVTRNENPVVNVKVGLKITEGPQTIVSDVAVTGAESLAGGGVREMIALAPGTPYRPNLVKDTRIALASRISERGYPHVRVELQVDISADRTQADITYRVAEGPYVEMGRTFFIGNFKTKRRTLVREMVLEPGEPFSLREMLVSQNNIRGVNALESADFQTIGLEEKAPRVDLLAEVHERKPYYFEFTTGYDTWRHVYVDTAVGTVNFLGRNKEVRAGLQWSQIGYLAQLGITEPSLFGSRIAVNGILFAEEREELNQEFGVRTYGAAVGLTREFLDDFTGTLNIGYERRELYRLDDTPIPPEDADLYDPRSVIVTTPGIIYNSTDSFVRPTRGTLTSIKVDISKGLENSFDDFLKYRLDSRYYFTPVDPVTLAFRGFFGYIDPYGDESMVPEDQLFYLGGTTDVRGFDENELRTDAEGDPVGGKTAIVGSVEVRFDIGWNMEFVTFYDGGTVRDPLTDAGADDWRSAVGAGLRYITPIGPIGLMYGRKLDRKEGESPGAVHFSIGYTF